MRSSSLPQDSYRPRPEVLEQQPELLSREDFDAQNKMVSKAHYATYSTYDYFEFADASSVELKERYFRSYNQDKKLLNRSYDPLLYHIDNMPNNLSV